SSGPPSPPVPGPPGPGCGSCDGGLQWLPWQTQRFHRPSSGAAACNPGKPPDFSAQIGNLPIPDPLDVDSVDQDDAAGRLLFTVHQFDEGTLPGATLTDHIAKLSLVNSNVDAPKSLHTVGIYLPDIVHFDHGYHLPHRFFLYVIDP